MAIDKTKKKQLSAVVPNEVADKIDELAASEGLKRGAYLSSLIIKHVRKVSKDEDIYGSSL